MENNDIVWDGNNEEPPPILSSWNQLYSLVLLNLVFLIILFYIFTKTCQ